MCGIAGVINPNRDKLESIKHSLFHRGPDEQSVKIYDTLALIHTRLSIVDISHSHQPMEIGDFVIIFNGEIYNHQELRKRHLPEINFQTDGDTETFLQMYIKYKDQALEFLDGMFSLAIYEKKSKKLFLGRDRAGKKPLYFYKKKEEFVFASEINAVKEYIDLKISKESLQEYVRCGYFPSSLTAYEDLNNFPAGSFGYYDLQTDSLSIKKYFSIDNHYRLKREYKEAEALQELDQKLHNAIKRRVLTSDLEVGTFLSGGIDSSLVTAISSSYTKKLKTFTVSFDGAYDESDLAELTAKRYETDHTTIKIGLDLTNDIEKILGGYGQPFWDSSAIPSWYVAREAKKHVTVILNGDGADEIFGGYRRYVPIANGWIDIASKLGFLEKVLPKSNNKKSYFNFINRLLELSSKKDPISKYLSTTTDLIEGYEEFFNIKENSSLKFVNEEKFSDLDLALINDFNNILFSDLLPKIDISSMAHSLEGRSPFLGKEILEFAPTLQDNLKIRGTKTKYILRELSKKYLDKKLLGQPKRGFEVPLKNWVEKNLKDMIYDTLTPNSFALEFVDREFFENLKNKKIMSDEKRAKILWMLFAMEVWKKADN
ncbi:MAG: asparagine synthase (glutamine-hydrolyzing) [Campylobacterales bacterium]|nr:asparagine synthase (glutamine-hydrolyzing) [Campylobacterales bacterium]